MAGKSKTVRPSRLMLDPRIFVKAKGESQKSVVRDIASQLKLFDFHGRYDLVRQIAAHPRLPKEFSPLYGKGTKFHGAVNLRPWISKEGYVHWLLEIFRRNRALLTDFLALRTRIAAQILKGDAVGALRNLASASDLSESWWAVELAIHINKELLDNDTKEQIKRLQEIYPDLNLSKICRDFLMLSESNSSRLFIDCVLGRIKEYKSSAVDHALERGATESYMFLPLYFDSTRTGTLDALRINQTWSIIDQYLLFRDIFVELPSTAISFIEHRDTVIDLANTIGDWELQNSLADNNEVDALVLEIIQKYTYGDYPFVIREVAKLVDEESPKSFGLIEVYARSKIYTSTIGSGRTFYDLLSDQFAHVLILGTDSAEIADYLHKICTKFRSDAWAKSMLYHLMSVKQWQSDDDALEIVRNQLKCLGAYNTPKPRTRAFTLAHIKGAEPSLIPNHRTLRYSDPVEKNCELDEAEFPIYSDYLKTKSRHLIENDQIAEALDFSIDEYLKNPEAFGYLPIFLLCTRIDGLERGDEFDYVSCLIIFDIYGRERDGEFEESKTELFEEFLENSGTFQPSRVFEGAKIDKKTAYFLRNLCGPSQLDNIIQFTDYDQVIHERVAIIDILLTAQSGNTEELLAEKDKVLETLFSEKLRAKIETGKLYVDVQALETHRRHIYSALYDQAVTLKGGINLDPLSPDSDTIDSTDLFQPVASAGVAVAASKKSSILTRIFLQAVNDFALNENYGLDKYLSAEVRHIVFITQIRSCFEKNELVTVQKSGEYLPNGFWSQKYDFMARDFVGEIDVRLRNFSREVDNILTKVNDRFSVHVLEQSTDKIFDFSPYHDRIVRVSEIISSSDNFESFFKALIAFMWQIAIEGARTAEQVINDILLVELLRTVDDLEAQIQELKGEVAMVDLMQAIKNSRSDLKKEIELALNWFRFVGSDDLQTYERLGVVVEAAVSSFQMIFKHKGKELVFSQQKSELRLNYSEARSLFISLFTALENALRYGHAGTSVTISHELGATIDRLVISNHLDGEIDDPLTFVGKHKAKWTSEYSSLSTSQGGSGLYKIHNLLTNASKGFRFDILIAEGQFNAIMDLNHEYFNNRRQPA